jgi:fatty-acid desaturase
MLQKGKQFHYVTFNNISVLMRQFVLLMEFYMLSNFLKDKYYILILSFYYLSSVGIKLVSHERAIGKKCVPNTDAPNH